MAILYCSWYNYSRLGQGHLHIAALHLYNIHSARYSRVIRAEVLNTNDSIHLGAPHSTVYRYDECYMLVSIPYTYCHGLQQMYIQSMPARLPFKGQSSIWHEMANKPKSIWIYFQFILLLLKYFRSRFIQFFPLYLLAFSIRSISRAATEISIWKMKWLMEMWNK